MTADPPTLVDAHTHLDFPEFDADRDAVVRRARDAGVRALVVCGSDPERWTLARSLGAVAFLGVHPWVAAALDDPGRAALLARLDALAPTGIGEIGLDRLHGRTPEAWERQVAAFREQLARARERDVPVVLHAVRATPEVLSILERDGLPAAGGMAHGWSGAPEQVSRALRLGLYVSFGPLVLGDRARKARASALLVPADRLLVETDCPDVRSPGERRGEPCHLVRVVAELARLRGETFASIATSTTANFEQWLPGRISPQ